VHQNRAITDLLLAVGLRQVVVRCITWLPRVARPPTTTPT